MWRWMYYGLEQGTDMIAFLIFQRREKRGEDDVLEKRAELCSGISPLIL